jgi:hypothetical protein
LTSTAKSSFWLKLDFLPMLRFGRRHAADAPMPAADRLQDA